MKSSLLLAFIFTANSVFACLNETRVSMRGELIEMSSEVILPFGHDYSREKNSLEKKLSELDNAWKTKHYVNDYSDYGVTLVKLGRYQEALIVFQEIEAKEPGLYATAANMGTTYELLGNNQLALEWIKKAVAINPGAHSGSEWLHVKILEVKIGGRKYLTTRFLLGTDFGSNLFPKSRLSKDSLYSLGWRVCWQLNERLSFVKPKEEIVAQLLFDLGNIYAITQDATSAYRVYEIAEKYGYDSPLFRQRYAYVKKMQEKLDPPAKAKADSAKENRGAAKTAEAPKGNPKKQPQAERKDHYSLYFAGGFVLVAVAAGLVLIRRRKRS